jgi:DNA-binding MarR family transcriptional regulator
VTGATTATTTGRDEAMRALEHEIGLLLRRIRRGMADRAAVVHPDLNLTSYTLLATLADSGPSRAADLADVFALDKGSVSRVVHQLLELGLIARTPDPKDGRASILEVTAEARKKLALMHETRRAQFDARMTEWAPEEIDDLVRSLGRFNQALAD